MYKFVLALALGAAHAADDLKEVHGHGRRLEALDGQIYSLETTFDVAGGRKLTEEELETTFDSDTLSRGNFFDVEVLQDLTIRNFDVHAFQTGTGRVEVWYRPGSYTGYTGSNLGWTLIYEDDAVALQGEGSHTPLGDFNGGAGLPLTVGTHAFLVYTPPPNLILYSYGGPNNSEGDVYAEDTALQILEGRGVGAPGFGGSTFYPRVWNGVVRYVLPAVAPTAEPTLMPTPCLKCTSTEDCPEGDAVYECVFPSARRNLRFGGYEKTGCCVDKTVAPTKYPTVAPTQKKICYEFALSSTSVKWDQCADVCAQIGMGASFGCIEDATQNAEAYAALVSGGEDVAAWIGLHDTTIEGVWVCSTSTQIPTYFNWDPNTGNSFSGEPNGGTGENCVNMWGPSAGHNRVPGKWNDWKCGYSYPCVCKTPVPCGYVESSLTFTVGTKTNAEGQGGNGNLYVKLWSGTTQFPLSPTVSVPPFTGNPGSLGQCSDTEKDAIFDNWSGASGWLKLDDINVETKGITSSQSLGPLDPTLPLTHIELYYNENDAVQVAGVTIQVGDTSYGLPASWSNENHPNGDGWLETDQSCVWWTKIDMEEL